MPKVVVLRWGHRLQRDARLTTHVVLTARALGASGLILSDIKDKRIKETVEKVIKKWDIQTSDTLKRIKASEKDILVVIGSQKVPKEFFSRSVSDFNLAIGNQPHSECASLAMFLDRFFEGEELTKSFENARIRITPQKRGKKLARK